MRGLIKSVVYFYFFTLMIASIGALLKCVTEGKEDLQCPYLRNEIGQFVKTVALDKYLAEFFNYLNIFDRTILSILAFNGYIASIALIITCVYKVLYMLHKGLGTVLQFALLIIFIAMLLVIIQKANSNMDKNIGVTFMGTAQEVFISK